MIGKAQAICGALLVWGAMGDVLAADWPQYMGPTRDHLSAETGLKKAWTAADVPEVRWRAEVGRGYSGVAIAAGRAYTMGHDGGNHETLWCFGAADGKVVWQRRYPAKLMPTYHGGGPNATPTIADGTVYAVSKDGQLQAVSAADGSVKWTQRLEKIFQVEMPTWGFASSPVLHDGVLWLYGNGPAALDPKTGQVIWTDGEGDKCGYASARIFERGGKTYVAGMSGTHLRIHDVKSRKQVASFEFKVDYDVNAMTPYVFDDGSGILLGNGYKSGRTARLAFDGSSLKETWFTRELKPQMNNPVVTDGWIYGVDGNNGKIRRTRLVCADLATGAIKWEHLGLGCGSVIHADGTNYVLSETGELLAAPASPEGFLPRGKLKLFNRGVCWTAPSLANGMLYARNDVGDVVCLDLTE